jgi:hypothetical protein
MQPEKIRIDLDGYWYCGKRKSQFTAGVVARDARIEKERLTARVTWLEDGIQAQGR